METLGTILGVILLVLAVFIIVAVLMQQGKSKGMGAVGGGSGADSFYGKNKGNTWDKKLAKITTICGIVFVVIVLLVYIIQKDINADDYFDDNIGQGETTAAATTAPSTPEGETEPAATDAATEPVSSEGTTEPATEATTEPETSAPANT